MPTKLCTWKEDGKNGSTFGKPLGINWKSQELNRIPQIRTERRTRKTRRTNKFMWRQINKLASCDQIRKVCRSILGNCQKDWKVQLIEPWWYETKTSNQILQSDGCLTFAPMLHINSRCMPWHNEFLVPYPCILPYPNQSKVIGLVGFRIYLIISNEYLTWLRVNKSPTKQCWKTTAHLIISRLIRWANRAVSMSNKYQRWLYVCIVD